MRILSNSTEAHALSRDITSASRYWLDRVLSCLGIAHSQRQECISRGSVALGDVVLLFIEPNHEERNYLIVRSIAGEMPPEGQCEPIYQIALEVQANFCGPFLPMLCLDWPSRMLMISAQLDTNALPADDAAQVLLGLREMALQWRATLAQHQAKAAAPIVATPDLSAATDKSPEPTTTTAP